MNLSRLRRRAASGYWVESLARALAPGCGILVAYIVAALFGFANPWAFAGIIVLALSAFGFGISTLRRPGPGAIDRRIERASGLQHRPLAMLEDEPENDGELAAAIWQMHQRQVAASLRQAQPGRPFIDAVARDPFALRGLLLLLLLAGAIIAGPQAIPRITEAFVLPEWPFAGPSVNAWLTPPSYTGDPPSVLQPGKSYSVLAGSSVTVVVNGKTHAPAAVLGAKSLRLGALAQDSFRADEVLTTTARLRIGPWWDPLARWQFNVSPPDAPIITLSKPFVANRQLILGWHVSDRYGLAALTVALMPVGHPKATPEILALPIPGLNPRDEDGVAKLDIGDSPYAGLPVSLVLMARNLAGVERSTSPVILTLPLPALHDKTALALAALRQKLALTPEHTQAAGGALNKLSQQPPSKITASADVQMAAMAQALKTGEISASSAQSVLARLSQEIEAGPDYQPARALAAAAQALEQALRQAAESGKPLDPGKLQSLLAAMQSALAQHLQALGAKGASNPGSQSINPGDLNRMAQQIAQDEAAGQTAKAQAELHQLEQMLSALQSAKPMSAADAARSATANQAAQDLGKITKAESELLDQTSVGNAKPGTQADLRRQLSSTQQKLGQANIPLPGLGDAATAMGTAQNALGNQDEPTAAAAEAQAIQGLQKAAAALSAASQGMSFDAGGQAGVAAGPLENGANGSPDENAIPTLLQSGGSTAGMIQQQIIKNDSNPALPDATHQYYHRLLNQDAP